MFRLLVFLLVAGSAALCRPTAAQPDLRDEVFYHFMPIAWRDSDADPNRFGDFGGMIDSLDYLESLGVTGVWMNPVFPSPAYHGYQHGPADQINSRFGTEQEFIDFVEEANSRGIKVFIDFVVYGISHDSPWFQDAFGNPASQYDDWLAFENPQNTQYLGSTYPTWNGDTVGFIHWNLDNPGPFDLVTQWGRKWLDPNEDGDFSDGIAGYRLDHVWVEYPNGPNGWGYNLDDFWIPWKQALKSVNPNVVTFAEQANWGVTGAELLPAFDAAFTKPFEFAARDAILSENAAGLYEQTARNLAELPEDSGTFLAIIGDHDVDRFTSVIGGSLERAKLGAAILMTQPFPPIIYHGDEIGMLGFKQDYGSDANDIPMREPFKWNAVLGPPMSNYWLLNFTAFQNRYSTDNDGRSVEEQSGVSGSLLETYRSLISIRHDNIALRCGEYYPIANSDSGVWSFLRLHDDQALVVAINLRSGAQSVSLDLGEFELPGGVSSVTDVETGLTEPDITEANSDEYDVSIPGWGWRLLEVDLGAPTPPVNLVDGVDIPGSYTPAQRLAVQNNYTGFGDNVAELNQLFARHSDEFLRIGIPGNLPFDGTGFVLLIDSVSGGQNSLDISNTFPPPSGPRELTGVGFDPGFAPDFMFFVNAFGGSIFVDEFQLPTLAPATKVYRGQGSEGSGQGLLTGGINPNGLQVAFDNSNMSGVTGSGAGDAASSTTGFEFLIPWEDVGINPDTPQDVRALAFISSPSGHVSNQLLPGLGGAWPNPGPEPDFTAYPGDQYLTIPAPCPADSDADGQVTVPDVTHVIFRLGDSGEPGAIEGDVNADGIVDIADISFVIFRLGEGC